MADYDGKRHTLGIVASRGRHSRSTGGCVALSRQSPNTLR